MVAEAPACVDAHAECSNWAKADECRNNPGFMLESCKRACGVCQPDEPKQTTAGRIVIDGTHDHRDNNIGNGHSDLATLASRASYTSGIRIARKAAA